MLPRWAARDEYEALGVDFKRRGRILDEQLTVMRSAWRGSPISSREHFAFEDVWLEPKAHRPEGPALWFGGAEVHPALVRRLAAYGSGYNPLGRISDEGLDTLADGMRAAGRDPAELELVGGLRGTFPDDDSTADLADAIEEAVPAQLARGFTSFCFKPNQFTDDIGDWSEVCAEAVTRVDEVATGRWIGVAAARARRWARDVSRPARRQCSRTGAGTGIGAAVARAPAPRALGSRARPAAEPSRRSPPPCRRPGVRGDRRHRRGLGGRAIDAARPMAEAGRHRRQHAGAAGSARRGGGHRPWNARWR